MSSVNENFYSIIDEEIKNQNLRPVIEIDKKIQNLDGHPEKLRTVVQAVEKIMDRVETHHLSYDYLRGHIETWVEPIRKASEEKEILYKKSALGKIRYIASIFCSLFQGKGFQSSSEKARKLVEKLDQTIKEQHQEDVEFAAALKRLNPPKII